MSQTERVQFPGYDGDQLDARLELPKGKPLAFALFAHCFSCSKDSLAASRISRRLTSHGIAVLRFDFTGIGGSDGDFANTNFSSNVQDVIAAAQWLRKTRGSCDLLVGHSLGGAAILVAALDLPDVRALVTIGSPSDADHVLGQIAPALETIETDGKADVELGPQAFTIKRQFVEDVRSARVRDAVSRLHRPLLVMHSPVDEIVGIDNATELFVAARHPKSFVSLDHADHLLSRKEDAQHAADTLAAWAARYVEADLVMTDDEESGIPRGTVRVAETGEGGYANKAETGDHHWPVDEPLSYGGLDTGPTPTELLDAALAACTTITLRMYLNRKGWKADHISTIVSHSRADDKNNDGWNPITFHREVEVIGELTEDQRGRIIEIANKCPVHKMLHHPAEIETKLKDSAED